MEEDEMRDLVRRWPQASQFLRPLIGTTEIRQGRRRWCVWVDDDSTSLAMDIDPIRQRIEKTRLFRASSTAKTTIAYSKVPHRFAQRCHREVRSLALPKNTVEGIRYLTPSLVTKTTITTDLAFVAFSEDLWALALLSSTLHRVWAEAISGGLGSGIRYSSLLTYNAFPLPQLTEQNKSDLTYCAEAILLARESHFPATIADLYEVTDGEEKMPENLRMAHERNDEVIERIYIGRRFKNDTERLEKLFEMYTKMTADSGVKKKGKKA
jgi:hypothetical protein